MLEPNNRRLLMESLQPPDGCKLDWAVGTTYTLDLLALLSAPVAFAFSDWQDRDGRPTADPLALLKAVRQYAGRVCIFCQSGRIYVPKAYQPLLASLEDSVVQANAPLGGSFHAKLWFLRFIGEDDAVTYRLLCLSRNMTFDRSWDTLLCLDGQLRDRVNAYSKNHPLGQFAELLPRISTRKLSAIWETRMAQLAYEIRRVEFEVPEPFESLEFWPLGIENSRLWPFPSRMDRLFIVSPFVDDGLATDLSDWETPMQLVSRGESLARLDKSTLRHFENVWVLDDTTSPEPGDMEEEGDALADSMGDDSENQDLPLVGLHAKLYVAEEGWYASVFTGSANATRAAFNKNVEFLVQLRGKKTRCGVAAALGESQDNGPKRASSLADLLQPYARVEDEVHGDAEAKAFERQVDELAKELAVTDPTAKVGVLSQPNSFSLRLLPSKPVEQHAARGFRLSARPISLPSGPFYTVTLAEPCWVEFAPMSLLGLTSFFTFQVESGDQKFQRQFVLNIPLDNVPQNRHEAILRNVLSDPDRVLRFLLMLLLDAGARDLGKLLDSGQKADGSSGFLPSMFGSTLFESLVRALDRDPERLEQVAEVIADLEKSAEAKQLLPADLAPIWEPIWATARKQIERKKRSRARHQKSTE